MYRRDDGGEPLSTYQQRLQEVYMPPEFSHSNMEPTLAGDVFRYRGGWPLQWALKDQKKNIKHKNTMLSVDYLQLLNHPAGDCYSQ